jgi:hypothetical protein
MEAAASQAREHGLSIEVETGFLPRHPEGSVCAHVSDGGGCACSLLSDDADWGAEFWAMRPEILERLADTLRKLASKLSRPVYVEVLWEGEQPKSDLVVTPDELSVLARQSRLSRNSRYVVQ